MGSIKSDTPVVQVLLATHNGERYLEEQLDSILSQDSVSVEILVADDGSTDSTQDIVRSYARRFPVELVSTERIGGSTKNFARLVAEADAELVAFSDQDDRWLPSKLKNQVDAMQGNGPELVFTDLLLMNQCGTLTGRSLFSVNRINPQRARFANVCVQNIAPGNASLMNKAALELVRPIPTGVYGHDWWCAAVVALFGSLTLVDEPGVAYRIHEANVVGSRQSANAVASAVELLGLALGRSDFFAKRAVLASELVRRWPAEILEADLRALEAISKGATSRLRVDDVLGLARNGGFRFGDRGRNVGLGIILAASLFPLPRKSRIVI